MTDLNTRLKAIYEEYYPNLVAALGRLAPDYPKLSEPLLMSVFDSYDQADHRLMVFGQQTNGWGTPGSDSVARVSELMANYVGFHVGEDYIPTPFWCMARELHRRLNPQSPQDGFLWNNVFKVDHAGGRPCSAVVDVLFTEFPVVPLEIQATEPEVVVFFTGPSIDNNIRSTFPGIEFLDGPSPDLSRRQLARLRQRSLPEKTFRTYHPGYLQRRLAERLGGKVMKTIVDYVTASS